MARITVFYDEQEGQQAPVWMILQPRRGEIDWSKSYTYVPIQAPFHRKLAEEFSDEQMSVSVHLEDLTINEYRPGYFGICLRQIQQRLNKAAEEDQAPLPNLENVEQLIMRMTDIEEILQIGAVRFYMP